MFKTGDIVVNITDEKEIGSEFRLCLIFDDSIMTATKDMPVISLNSGIKGHAVESHYEPYTGPIYEKGGQRFVISGEVRPPQNGEWYTHAVSGAGITQAECAPYDNSDCVIILLLVPEVEPEFKVGDYIKHKISGKVLPYKDDYYQFVAEDWEKHIDPFLEGTREITDEDLVNKIIFPASKILVRCRHHCCHDKNDSMVEGIITSQHYLSGFIGIKHDGNEEVFATVRGENEGWKVIWQIPKSDIRVILN